jgi:hypothetical protein
VRPKVSGAAPLLSHTLSDNINIKSNFICHSRNTNKMLGCMHKCANSWLSFYDALYIFLGVKQVGHAVDHLLQT